MNIVNGNKKTNCKRSWFEVEDDESEGEVDKVRGTTKKKKKITLMIPCNYFTDVINTGGELLQQ